MSEKKRNSFSGQTKAKVALEAIRGTKTVNEIAQAFGVHPTQVGLWKKALLEQTSELFEVRRGPKLAEESAGSERLYSEIGRLKMGKRGQVLRYPHKISRQNKALSASGSTAVQNVRHIR